MSIFERALQACVLVIIAVATFLLASIILFLLVFTLSSGFHALTGVDLVRTYLWPLFEGWR